MANTSPNEEWWSEHGGEEWLEEVERRRSRQPQYAAQEAFLTRHMGELHKPRVLDFGCGFGRNLAVLSSIEGLEAYGVDASAKMVATARSYAKDHGASEDRIQLISADARLPFPDDFFDVSFTCEVLIHVAPERLAAILRELIRVTKTTLLHIENREVTESSLENDEHGGCWLHDLRGAYSDLNIHRVELLPNWVGVQDIYTITLDPTWEAERAARLALEQQLGEAQADRARLEQALSDLGNERNNLKLREQQALERLDHARQEAHREATLLNEAVDHLDARLREFQSEHAIADANWRAELERASGLQEQLDAIAKSMGWRLLNQFNQSPVAPLIRNTRGAVRNALTIAAGLRQPDEPRSPARPAQKEKRSQRAIEGRQDVVAVCHPEWLGIRSATYAMMPSVIESAELYDDAAAFRIVDEVSQARARLVVLSGFPDGYAKIVEALRTELPGVQIGVLWHGALTQLHDPYVRTRLFEVLRLVREGSVQRLGFVKIGLAGIFERLEITAQFVMNVFETKNLQPTYGPTSEQPQIGMFAVGATPNKNHYTQLAAASTIPNATVNVTAVDEHLVKFAKTLGLKLRVHGRLRHAAFLELVAGMDVTMTVSLSECCPMTVLESLALGVPAVTSDTSHIYSDDPYLRERLIVTAHDNPTAIAATLRRALEEKAELGPTCVTYLREYNKRAIQTQAAFLEL